MISVNTTAEIEMLKILMPEVLSTRFTLTQPINAMMNIFANVPRSRRRIPLRYRINPNRKKSIQVRRLRDIAAPLIPNIGMNMIQANNSIRIAIMYAKKYDVTSSLLFTIISKTITPEKTAVTIEIIIKAVEPPIYSVPAIISKAGPEKAAKAIASEM